MSGWVVAGDERVMVIGRRETDACRQVRARRSKWMDSRGQTACADVEMSRERRCWFHRTTQNYTDACVRACVRVAVTRRTWRRCGGVVLVARVAGRSSRTAAAEQVPELTQCVCVCGEVDECTAVS